MSSSLLSISLLYDSPEKENTETMPTSSTKSSSIFQNLFSQFSSPLKSFGSSFAGFKYGSGSHPEEIHAEDGGKAGKLVEFYQNFGRTQLTARITRIMVKYAQNAAVLSRRQLTSFENDNLLLRLSKTSTKWSRKSETREKSQSDNGWQLEGIIMAIKHALSAQFHMEQIPYPNGRFLAQTQNPQPVFLSGDSLTFEFFNTIAPFLPGSAFAKFDVFLTGINSEQNKIHFWDHILSFTSPVNQKRRQNRVLEIWVPQLANCCDELLLVVEGRVMEEGNSTLQNSRESLDYTEANLAKRKSLTAHKRSANLTISEMAKYQKVITLKPNGQRRRGDELTVTAKRRKMGEEFEKKQPEMKETKMPSTPISISPQKKYKTVPTKTTLMVFRGMKSIGKWQNDTDDKEENELIKEKKNSNGTAKTFQPLYTHNGMILNVFDEFEPELIGIQPDYSLIEHLAKMTKVAAKGTCHMLQMEISNENGYGEAGKGKVRRQNAMRKSKDQKLGQATGSSHSPEIRYSFEKLPASSVENSQEMASKAPMDSIGLSSLQLLPSSNVPLPCLICARQFWHIRDLAIHLTASYPSLHFDFLMPQKDAAQIQIRISEEERKSMEEKPEAKNFQLGRKAIAFLRDRQFFGHLADKKLENLKKLESNDDNLAKKNANKMGKFHGILPFNQANYTELDVTPFANLYGVDCDRSWVQDTYTQRLNQFTDVSPKEKQFFAIWNCFIGQRANRPVGTHSLPILLERFVDHCGQELYKESLFSNLVYHCEMLTKYEYITSKEMLNVLMHATEMCAKWRGEGE